jgi:hypothetical protein
MKSRTVESFWDHYQLLPPKIQLLALKQYRLWQADPRHPSLCFKKVGLYWSARVTNDYRAVGIMDGDTIVWFFIGTHVQYTRILKRK